MDENEAHFQGIFSLLSRKYTNLQPCLHTKQYALFKTKIRHNFHPFLALQIPMFPSKDLPKFPIFSHHALCANVVCGLRSTVSSHITSNFEQVKPMYVHLNFVRSHIGSVEDFLHTYYTGLYAHESRDVSGSTHYID